MEYEENLINSKQLSKIFKSSIDRSLFIFGYEHFGRDGNDDFYKNFVEMHIYKNKSKAQEDCIELAIALKYYNYKHLLIIKNIILSRRSDWLKLLCLDWAFNFHQSIPPTEFLEINDDIVQNNDVQLLIIQAILNIFLIHVSTSLFSILKSSMQNVRFGAPYYRIIAFIENNILEKKVSDDIRRETELAIQSNKILGNSQKADLLQKVNSLCTICE